MIYDPFRYAEGKRVEITNLQAREIKQLYREAYNDIQREYRYLKNQTTEYAMQRKQYLNDLKKEYVNLMRSIDAQTESIITRNVDEMVQVVLTNNQQYLSGLGYNKYINNPAIKSDVVNRIMTGQVYNGKWSLSSAIWGDNAKKTSEIEKIIAKGIAENKTIDQIAQQLTRYVNPNKRLPYNIVGVRNTVDYNALRLAKTMVQHAYQQAFVAATRLNPFIEGYKWITSGGHNVCELCIERATTDKYGLGEGVFPKDALPLDHPNGQCTFSLVTSMSEEEMAEAIADWYFWQNDLFYGDEKMNREIEKFARYLENP